MKSIQMFIAGRTKNWILQETPIGLLMVWNWGTIKMPLPYPKIAENVIWKCKIFQVVLKCLCMCDVFKRDEGGFKETLHMAFHVGHIDMRIFPKLLITCAETIFQGNQMELGSLLINLAACTKNVSYKSLKYLTSTHKCVPKKYFKKNTLVSYCLKFVLNPLSLHLQINKSVGEWVDFQKFALKWNTPHTLKNKHFVWWKHLSFLSFAVFLFIPLATSLTSLMKTSKSFNS